jgi:putative ABC transport system permease protein
MIINYLKIAFRNLLRQKAFSFTNILGLSIGLACALFIVMWILDEFSYDRFFKNYDTIYSIKVTRTFDNTKNTDGAVAYPLTNAIAEKIPQVKYAVESTYPSSHVLAFNENKITKTGYQVSANFFKLFTFPFLQGNAATAVTDPNSVVLTAATAQALFGNNSPLGKLVTLDNQQTYKVTGVIGDIPHNSTLQFDFVIPYSFSPEDYQHVANDWVNAFNLGYIEVLPGTNIAALEKQINQLYKQNNPNDDAKTSYLLQPMSEWRLYSDFKDGKNVGGMIDYVHLFSIIAVVILLIACINFMNLSTAQAEKRAKEVGVRKTLGSDRASLVFQFFMESFLMVCIAFVIALLLVYLLLPSFNLMVDKQIKLPFANAKFWLYAVLMIVFTAIVAGIYPAVYLSSFNAATVLKGTFKASNKLLAPRKLLVIGQFAASFVLIVATIIVYQQIQHARHRDLGYNPNDLIIVSSSPELDNNYEVLKQQLLNTGVVDAVTRTTSPMTEIWNYSPAPDWPGRPQNNNFIVSAMAVGSDFAKTTGARMIAGRDFKEGSIADSTGIIYNKAAMDKMNLPDPIGKQVKFFGKTFTIIGVMDNIVMASPYKQVDPMIMLFYDNKRPGFVDIRLKNGVQPQNAIPKIAAIYKTLNPAYPFEYKFADDEFNKKFATEELIGKLTNIFASISIFICCIGLAGLVSFSIQKRFKEIAIRKILGASVWQIIELIAADFLKLVAIAIVIAIPITWWLMNGWLNNYTYHVTIQPMVFALVAIVMLLITLIIVGLNARNAATTNPATVIKSE